MPTFTYNRDIPFSSNNPSDDQPNMLTNTNNTDDIIAVDHNSFNVPNGGWHTTIHQENRVSDPAAILSVGQTYTKQVNTNVELFYRASNGAITQLTGPNTSSASGNGYVWLPGGILLQWGSQSLGGSSDKRDGTVTFATSNIAFPNNCFNVQLTLSIDSISNSTASNTIAVLSKSATNFVWKYNSSSGSGSADFTPFYWVAIGN